MTDRYQISLRLLAATPWADAQRVPLAGDASERRYFRLTDKTGGTAILMDDPPVAGQSTAAFLRIARILRQAELSAPAILAADPANGLLLIEDFGDALFPAAIQTHPEQQPSLYRAAVDVLVHLQSLPAPDGLVRFDPAMMAEQAGLVGQWYAASVNNSWLAALRAELETQLSRFLVGNPVLILRDFHAENLVWLPERQGISRVGLLDFQDAMAGPAGYDLVSLLQDARRDVPAALAREMTDRFTAVTDIDPHRFRIACAILGAQRSLRVLGVFARLSRQRAKPTYVDMIPRVWRHLKASLTQPRLSRLRHLVFSELPEPDPAHLKLLRAPCR